MPLYSFHCNGCEHEFETLLFASDSPACPQCGGQDLTRRIGRFAYQGKTQATVAAARRQAAREGHFSNYNKAELKGK